MPETDDVIIRMKDLVRQAAIDRSHYYVASTLVAGIAEIERLRGELDRARALMTLFLHTESA